MNKDFDEWIEDVQEILEKKGISIDEIDEIDASIQYEHMTPSEYAAQVERDLED